MKHEIHCVPSDWTVVQAGPTLDNVSKGQQYRGDNLELFPSLNELFMGFTFM
jgi:hypothetical protein